MWTNELELKFIEYFQSEPILWDPKHKYYKDKSLNHDAWNRLGEMMQMEVSDLKKKKESLFASYRKYRKLVKDSLKSGAGESDIYKPIWFAYDALDAFLNQGLTTKTINTSLINTEEPRTSENNKENTQSSEQTSSPRVRQSEVKEAGKYLKEALSTFQENIRKRESTAPPDECEIYGTMLAKKLRAFSEMERLEVMYEIDGLILNRRRRSMESNASSRSAFVLTSDILCRRPSSSMTSYSEPARSGRVYGSGQPRQTTRISYSEPPQIHIVDPSEIHTQVDDYSYTEPPQLYIPEPPEDHTQVDEPNVIILQNDVISEAYKGA